MTSLFNTGDAGRGSGALPVDLMAIGLRGVSPLEFLSVDGVPSCHPAGGQTEAELGSEARAMQLASLIELAREDAVRDLRVEYEAEAEVRLREERARVQALHVAFAQDRQRYFAAAEAQVVRLALEIAKRVLAREVAADEMHLESTVRAALARVHDGSATVLRVREDDCAAWTAMFSADAGVTVRADGSLNAGECVLDTEVGRVELGVAAQLGEIRRGFNELVRRQGK